MTFSIIMLVAGLVILDGIITYYTFRKTEKEVSDLRVRLYSQGTDLCSLKSQLDIEGPMISSNTEHIAAIRRDVSSMRDAIRKACNDIESRIERLERKSAPKTDSVISSAPHNNENHNKKNKKNKNH